MVLDPAFSPHTTLLTQQLMHSVCSLNTYRVRVGDGAAGANGVGPGLLASHNLAHSTAHALCLLFYCCMQR